MSASLYRRADRGVVRVEGGDRVRWLGGMVSNEVTTLVAAPSGEKRCACYALLLSRQGRIVADFHVVNRGEAFELVTSSAAVADILETLGKFIVADDVTLSDVSREFGHASLEGEGLAEVLAGLGASELAEIPQDDARIVDLAGHPTLVVAGGESGAPALQLVMPAAAADAVARAVEGAGAQSGERAELERLRIEAGVPTFGAELGPGALPAEARLEDRAISTTKGCYTGQEVVERMRSQGKVGRLLVGLRFGQGAEASGATPGDRLTTPEGARVGEITSVTASPRFGEIALAFVRPAQAEPGSRLVVAERADLTAEVCPLPFAP